MRRVERFIDIDPVAQWEDRFFEALEDILESVPEEDYADALSAFRNLGISLYTVRMVEAITRFDEMKSGAQS